MKLKHLLMLAPLVGLIALFLTACSHDEKKTGADSDVDYYTCTMHPSVKSKVPGKCPICGMELVPVKKKTATLSGQTGQSAKSTDMSGMAGMPGMKGMEGSTNEGMVEEHPTEFTVPTARQQLIGVTYAAVEKKPLQSSLRAVGTVTYDKQRHWDFVSRIEGYVQKLEIASRGDVVEKNQPLLTIYSPDLLTTEQEFLNLLRMRDEAQKSHAEAVQQSTQNLIESAKRRLSLWNITAGQIQQLEQSREAAETLTLYSPFKGVVQNLQVDQGRRVSMGDHLVDVADLSVVWVWAQFYQDELPLLKKGLQVIITTDSYPGEKFSGKIALVDPFINDASRTIRVRVDIENPDFKLRPDMYVNVSLKNDAGEGLAVPVSAVLPTGEHNVVFVDKGEGRLEPRFVELGRKYGEDYAVVSGLQAGERVVNSANFLIDAESKVQGALKSW
ncbi:MAG: Efflux transporter, family, subunit [Pedosphaera sp.]|nr:Efflux transporter, family, subunit [Pedosphaera sp.]